MSAIGGEPEALTQLGEGQRSHRWPQLLPGGGAVLYSAHTTAGRLFDPGTIEAVEVATRQQTVVQAGASFGRYLPTGHLVYVADRTLFAVPFDAAALELDGSAVPIVSGLSEDANGQSLVSVSQSGTLAYLAGRGDTRPYPVVWVDRQGNTTPLWDEPGEYADPRLSPDGTRLALTVHRDGNVDVWIYDIERGVPRRLTDDPARDDEQIWSPDGQFVAFSSDRDPPRSVYRVRADGSGAVERLTEGDHDAWPDSWSADGPLPRVYGGTIPKPVGNLWVLPLEGDREPQVYRNTAAVDFIAGLLAERALDCLPVVPGG